MSEAVTEGRPRHPGRPVEARACDEHRAGLKPVPRRVRAERGRRPVAVAEPRCEWLDVYGFVRPSSGAAGWFPGDRVDTALSAAVPARFARAVGAGRDEAVLLVLDQAGWHASERLAVPAGVRLVSRPPSSPELQPAERLWPLAREAVANRHFATLAELDRALADQPDLVKAHTRFHRWPEAA